jgi:type I restriction enzyme R subunit
MGNGHVARHRDGFDGKRAIFSKTVLKFNRETQPKEWAKLESFHGECSAQ